jgi:hypothetical protein
MPLHGLCAAQPQHNLIGRCSVDHRPAVSERHHAQVLLVAALNRRHEAAGSKLRADLATAQVILSIDSLSAAKAAPTTYRVAPPAPARPFCIGRTPGCCMLRVL